MRSGIQRWGAILWLILGVLAWVLNATEVRAQGSDPVRIALVLSCTGIAADDNRPSIDAARLAVAEVNEGGGLHGRPLEMLLIDNQSTPLGSKRAAEKAARAGVLGVIGPLWSSHAMPMAGVLQEAGIPMIATTATKPEITTVGDCIFRVCFSDDLQGRVMARFAYEDLGARTAVVMKNASESYSITLARVFVQSFAEAGGRVLLDEAYQGTAVDFQGILERGKGVQADVFFIPGYARDSGLLIKQAVNMGIRATFLGGDGWGDRMWGYAGTALTGSCYSTQYHPDVPFPGNRHLKEMYRVRLGVDRFTDVGVPLAYDAVMLFADAVRRAVRPDRESVVRALASTRDFQGAAGTITFDDRGDPRSKEVCILRFEAHQSVFIKAIAP